MLLIPNITNDWTKSRFFYLHICEISKVVCMKVLSGECCTKPACTIITSVCWSHRIASGFAGVLHDKSFLVNNIADFRDVVQVKNQDYFQLLVVFGISIISYSFVFEMW